MQYIFDKCLIELLLTYREIYLISNDVKIFKNKFHKIHT
jgi:hypothetical protein